jgi:hypothetical protein
MNWVSPSWVSVSIRLTVSSAILGWRSTLMRSGTRSCRSYMACGWTWLRPGEERTMPGACGAERRGGADHQRRGAPTPDRADILPAAAPPGPLARSAAPLPSNAGLHRALRRRALVAAVEKLTPRESETRNGESSRLSTILNTLTYDSVQATSAGFPGDPRVHIIGG